MTSFVIKVSKIYLWYQFLDKIGSIFSQIAPDLILTIALIYAHKMNENEGSHDMVSYKTLQLIHFCNLYLFWQSAKKGAKIGQIENC